MGEVSRLRERHRKDGNHAELVALARMLGWHIEQYGPLDIWGSLTGKPWFPIEIKDPKRKGKPSEYTDAQKRFLDKCRMYGSKWLIWRDAQDVLTSTQELKK